MTEKAKMLCNLIITIGVINFLASIAFSIYLGGDALSGYRENGRFYVSSHGHATQVSEGIWKLSWLHTIIMLITWLIAMVAGFYLSHKDTFPAMMFCGDNKMREQKEFEVRSTPITKATFYCAAKVGKLQLNRRSMKITIHSNGLHFQPFYMQPFGILESEIVGFVPHKSYWRTAVEIQHTSSEIAKPLVLFLDDDSNAFEKMKQMKLHNSS